MTDAVKTEKDVPDISSGSDRDFRIRPLSEMALPDQKMIKQIGWLIFGTYVAVTAAVGFTLNSGYGSRYKADLAYSLGEIGHDCEYKVCREVSDSIFRVIDNESVFGSPAVGDNVEVELSAGTETIVGETDVKPADDEFRGFVAPQTDVDFE